MHSARAEGQLQTIHLNIVFIFVTIGVCQTSAGSRVKGVYTVQQDERKCRIHISDGRACIIVLTLQREGQYVSKTFTNQCKVVGQMAWTQQLES